MTSEMAYRRLTAKTRMIQRVYGAICGRISGGCIRESSHWRHTRGRSREWGVCLGCNSETETGGEPKHNRRQLFQLLKLRRAARVNWGDIWGRNVETC